MVYKMILNFVYEKQADMNNATWTDNLSAEFLKCEKW